MKKTSLGPKRGGGEAMGSSARTDHYGLLSRVNHWMAACGFMGALGLGLLMAYGGLDREAIGGLMNWHKALGVFVFVFGLWRVGWRVFEGFAIDDPSAPLWQRRLARGVHIALLAAVLLMPLSGILMIVAGGRPLEAFGVGLLPSFGELGWLDALADWMHGTLGVAIAGILALHVLAGLKQLLMRVMQQSEPEAQNV